MELEEVEVGRIDWVSYWFENSSISDEIFRPCNERTSGHGKTPNCRIGRDFPNENSIVLTERR